jgi:hypothetical protein
VDAKRHCCPPPPPVVFFCLYERRTTKSPRSLLLPVDPATERHNVLPIPKEIGPVSLNLACIIVYDEAERHNPTSCSRTGKTKQCSLTVKFTCKNYFAAGVYLSEGPLPLLGFRLGWSSNFVGSESGQIQSVKLLAEYGLQQNPVLRREGWEGGRVEPERRREGQQGRVRITKLG